MNLLLKAFKGIFFLMLFAALMVSCGEEEATTVTPITPTIEATGTANIEITDAPSDDPNIKGIFVTVAEVKIDGQTFEGFKGKTTIELSAYHSGQTEALGFSELETGSYNNITLVLDYEKDASGNSPGCYALTNENEKESLATDNEQTVELTIAKNFIIEENETTDLVIDFDLRKAVKSDDDANYSFAAKSALEASLRIVEKSETGNVKGQGDADYNGSKKIIVYAYAKGGYSDAETEGASKFNKAVTSAAITADNQFTLAFLEEGDYELVFASYEDKNDDGQLELVSQLEINTLLNLESNIVSVSSQTDVSIDIEFTGVLGIGG